MWISRAAIYAYFTSSSQTACLIRVPTEVIKTRTQTSAYGEHIKSSFFALRMTVAQEGIRGLYKGFGITVMREVMSCSSI